jgi:isochorismate hydrolase
LILAGLTADICILFTPSDAHMRDDHLVIPSDFVASQDSRENQRALRYMQRVLEADTRPSIEINFEGPLDPNS